MEDARELPFQLLSNQCDPNSFNFENTLEIVNSVVFIGQKRAYEAIIFGLRIEHDGYNLYALGPESIGKQLIVTHILKEEAAKKETPSDWCYVYNFSNPRYPLALELPAGMGIKLKSHMEKFIANLKTTIPAIFETEEHQARINQIQEETTAKQKEYFDSLQEKAEKNGMTILSTSKGFVVVPIRKGKVLTTKGLEALSEKERVEQEEITEELNEQLTQVITHIQKLQKKRRKQERKFDREFTLTAIKFSFNKLKKNYADHPRVLQYLEDVKENIASNPRVFLQNNEEPTSVMWGESHPSEFVFSRYQVNLIVDNSELIGAPVIYEDNPRYYKLFGRIEHVSQLGSSVTDFSLIRQGSLHCANGGYLILDSAPLLEQSWSWEALKTALIEKQIKIELPPHMISVTSTSTIEPEAIPLNVKIVLLGDRVDYYYLRDTDAKFNEWFKVAVDFEERIHRDEKSLVQYASLIANLAEKREIKPLDRMAVARIIDRLSRIVEDSEKLALDMHYLINLLEEADYWAGENHQEIITQKDVQQAIDFQYFRLNHYQQMVYEEIRRNITLINTEGEIISQINGLTTYRFGDFTFGFPSRITAMARMGRDGILDIEREVDLSGPIHSKGVLILSGFLRGRYAQSFPLTLSASIVFEQSYTPVDGDSASVAELCSLLSALSHLPIKQSLAVTGSVNQHGIVQAVGCINEKIEGFFDVCQQRGLTGDQGVIIPSSNVNSLMLREDVRVAAKNKQFRIYSVETIDHAICLLLGVPSGTRDEQGHYPVDTVNYRVEKQLEEFAKIHKKWTKG